MDYNRARVRSRLHIWALGGWLLVPSAATGLEAPSDPGEAVAERPTVSVPEAVQEALAHNLSLLSARYNVPIARAELITAKLRPNPVVSIGADHLDWLGTGYDAINGAGPAEFFIRADVLLRGARKRKRRIEVAEQGIKVAELSLEDTARQLVLEVQLACVELQLAAESVALAQRNVELFERVAALSQIRVRAGEVAKVELTRTEIAQLQARRQLQQAEAAEKLARNRLARLLGRTSTGRPLRVSSPLRADRPSVELVELRTIALQSRPDYRAVRATQALTTADIRRQIAEGKIDFGVGVEARRQQGIAGTGNSLGLFFEAPIPIFDRNQGGVERARQENLAAGLRIQAMEQVIRTEVEDAFVAFETARDLLGSIEGEMLHRAEQVLMTAEYAYKHGEASLLELLDAQRAFNDVRQAYNEARAAYARALYTIEAVQAGEVSG